MERDTSAPFVGRRLEYVFNDSLISHKNCGFFHCLVTRNKKGPVRCRKTPKIGVKPCENRVFGRFLRCGVTQDPGVERLENSPNLPVPDGHCNAVACCRRKCTVVAVKKLGRKVDFDAFIAAVDEHLPVNRRAVCQCVRNRAMAVRPLLGGSLVHFPGEVPEPILAPYRAA